MNVFGAENWHILKSDAERAQFLRKWSEAVKLYQQALSATDDENAKARIYAGLADAYLHLKKRPEAHAAAEKAIELADRLSKQRKIDPDLMVDFKLLADDYDNASLVQYPNWEKMAFNTRHRYNQQFMGIRLRLNEIAQVQNKNFWQDYAQFLRTYIALNEYPKAIRLLEGLIARSKGNEGWLPNAKLKLAAMKETCGDPKLINEWRARNKDKYGEAMMLNDVATEQLWAANYDGCRRTLERVLKLTTPVSKATAATAIRAYDLQGEICEDGADRRGALPYYKKALKLAEKFYSNSGSERLYRSFVARCEQP